MGGSIMVHGKPCPRRTAERELNLNAGVKNGPTETEGLAGARFGTWSLSNFALQPPPGAGGIIWRQGVAGSGHPDGVRLCGRRRRG
jgi:hypothetical protein